MSWSALLPDLDLFTIVHHLILLGLAFVLVLPAAWDREQARRLGLRTFPLVAVASCGFVLLGRDIADGSPDAAARVLQGTITGIGFLGGGAIVKSGMNVHGTATAAAIWSTAAIGAAVAHERLEIALVLAVIGFITLRWMAPLKNLTLHEHPGDGGDESNADT